MTTDDRERTRANWFDEMEKARIDCMAGFRECDDRGVPLRNAINPSRDAIQLHHRVCDYHSHFAPYAETGVRFDGWDEVVGTILVPTAGEYEAGRTNDWGEVDLAAAQAAIDFHEVPVTCGNIIDEWLEGKHVAATLLLDNGDTSRQVSYRVYIPPYIAHRLRSKLDIIRARLKWLPDPGEQSSADNPPAPPEHVQENAPGFDGGYE
jgi:hypothetical protein